MVIEDAASNQDFWQGRRVLVTGHTGFKGSWLALWLQGRGAEVTGYALEPPTQPSLFEQARVEEGMTSVIADVRDAARLQEVLHAHQPEVVFHLAAQPLVRYAYEHPLETYATNVMGTAHLLEAARHTDSVRGVVVVTSDKCYENREWAWGYREDEAMGGHDPYSSSKGCAELIVSAYRRSYFSDGGAVVAVASARAGNVIGGGDWAADRLVPDVMRAFLDGRAVRIRSPHAIRPWQHVLESLSGYLLLAERLCTQSGRTWAEGWNFGPAEGDARPVGWVVEHLAEHWGEGAEWIDDSAADHPHEAHYLKLDASKARARLGWRPRLPLPEALRWTVAWYRDQDEDPRRRTLKQIRRYEQLRRDEPDVEAAPADAHS